jgi:hypothetical protein
MINCNDISYNAESFTTFRELDTTAHDNKNTAESGMLVHRAGVEQTKVLLNWNKNHYSAGHTIASQNTAADQSSGKERFLSKFRNEYCNYS